MEFRRSALAVFCVLGLAQSVPALTIDNFEEGDFAIVDPAGLGTTGEQSGLLLTNVRGGVRLVRVTATGTPALTASAVLATTPGDDAAVLSGSATGEIAIFWDGVPGGTANGINGALNLDLSPFAALDIHLGLPAPGALLAITLWDSVTFEDVSSIVAVDGLNRIGLNANFSNVVTTDIQSIRLVISEVSAPVTLEHVSAAVPEPGTALLLALGLGGLALRRGRA